MRKHLTIIFLLVWHFWSATAQEDFSSPLPIVIIETDCDPSTGLPLDIPDEPKVGGTMKIIYINDQQVNHYSDRDNPAYLNYNGRIGIELRGKTSQNSPKKPYGLTTLKADSISNNNVALVGMPKENDWILNPFFSDESYLRDALTYALGRRTGHYAPRTRYCELFLNGDYKGLYLLSEKIKIDKNRVDITKMTTADTLMPNVMGGYLFKADKPDANDSVAWSTPSIAGFPVTYIIQNPKVADIRPQQTDYILSYFNDFQRAMDNGDNDSVTGYPSLIDVASFVDYMLVAELSSNPDSYQFSTFFHKNRQGKLCAGPLWDFNIAFGNDWHDRSKYDVWQFCNEDNTGSPFWNQLFNDSIFHQKLVQRWSRLNRPGAALEYNTVMYLIDSLVNVVTPVVARDQERWGIEHEHDYYVMGMRQWLKSRYQWMNTQLLGADFKKEYVLAPNPTMGAIHLEGDLVNAIPHITIYTLEGVRVIDQNFTLPGFSIDLSSLASGMYIAYIHHAKGIEVQKIIKL